MCLFTNTVVMFLLVLLLISVLSWLLNCSFEWSTPTLFFFRSPGIFRIVSQSVRFL